MSQFKDWLNRTFNGKKIEMLGLKDAGKTQFLKSLGCKEANPEVESQTEKYNWFKVSYPEKEVYVKASYDSGGGREIFTEIFNKRIKSSDWILFIIDIEKYLHGGTDEESNESYQQQVNDRLYYINKHTPEHYNNKIAIVLSHADLVPQPSGELINNFQRMTHEKAFKVLTKHCYSLDARDEKAVLNCFKRITGICKT